MINFSNAASCQAASLIIFLWQHISRAGENTQKPVHTSVICCKSCDGSHRIIPVQSRGWRSDTHVCTAPEAQPLVCVVKLLSTCGHLPRSWFIHNSKMSLFSLYVQVYFYLQTTAMVLVCIFSFRKLSDLWWSKPGKLEMVPLSTHFKALDLG